MRHLFLAVPDDATAEALTERLRKEEVRVWDITGAMGQITVSVDIDVERAFELERADAGAEDEALGTSEPEATTEDREVVGPIDTATELTEEAVGPGEPVETALSQSEPATAVVEGQEPTATEAASDLQMVQETLKDPSGVDEVLATPTADGSTNKGFTTGAGDLNPDPAVAAALAASDERVERDRTQAELRAQE